VPQDEAVLRGEVGKEKQKVGWVLADIKALTFTKAHNLSHFPLFIPPHLVHLPGN
jgi:hypothetical protein